MKLTFLGAAGTVTGSKYLLGHRGRKLLIDCGLFQGWKALREMNWEPLPFDARDIDAVLLTHAHRDHSGALPLLVRQGFRGMVLATPPTIDLCKLLLPDSGRIQEEDAAFANRHHTSRHQTAQPEPAAADALRQRIERELGWPASVPLLGRSVEHEHLLQIRHPSRFPQILATQEPSWTSRKLPPRRLLPCLGAAGSLPPSWALPCSCS